MPKSKIWLKKYIQLTSSPAQVGIIETKSCIVDHLC
jgi:hypothetical protein